MPHSGYFEQIMCKEIPLETVWAIYFSHFYQQFVNGAWLSWLVENLASSKGHE